MLTLELLDTGLCSVPERLVMRGGAWQQMACHALVGLIRHPRHGLMLFDTGYAPRILTATEAWPYRLYQYATPLHLRPELALVTQLAARGISSAEVGHVIISHLHADHLAGLSDFPAATMVISAQALQAGLTLNGVAALRRGYIPALLPRQRVGKALTVPLGHLRGPALPHLGPTHDLFGDGSILLLALPGHAYGQMGALLQTIAGPMLLAADGAWTSRAIREGRPPARLTNLIVDDPRAVRATLNNLRAFAKARPDVRIVPCHCPEVFASLGK
jgi:glyoxylase-like metal-dependent hydrolase (beta-lactamase superfamily II)